jgi:hypothetical protein
MTLQQQHSGDFVSHRVGARAACGLVCPGQAVMVMSEVEVKAIMCKSGSSMHVTAK